jgi:hypothetical protein
MGNKNDRIYCIIIRFILFHPDFNRRLWIVPDLLPSSGSLRAFHGGLPPIGNFTLP